MMRYRQCLCHNFPSTVATPNPLSSRLHLSHVAHQTGVLTDQATTLLTGSLRPTYSHAETTDVDAIKC